MEQQPNQLADQIQEHIDKLDILLDLSTILGDDSISSICQDLIECFRPDGAISYEIGKKSRYRTSPLATVLVALNDINFLPEEALHVMQQRLFQCKDKIIKTDESFDDELTQDQDDVHAWSIDEGASVWTTSMALYALLHTGFADRCSEDERLEMIESVKWLCNQRDDNGNNESRWGYQKYRDSKDCDPSMPMTALALKAIGEACICSESLYKGSDKCRRKAGFPATVFFEGRRYALKEMKESPDHVYWEYNNKPSIAATVWMIEALKYQKHNVEFSLERHQEIKEKVKSWILAQLPDFESMASWPSEEFFSYSKSKYKQARNGKKNFYYFMPYTVTTLLEMGVSSYHPKVISCIRWLLINTKSKWAMQQYNSPMPCTFSAAMAINSIVRWVVRSKAELYNGVTKTLIVDQKGTVVCKGCELHISQPDRTFQIQTIQAPAEPKKAGINKAIAAWFCFVGIIISSLILMLFNIGISAFLVSDTFTKIRDGWIIPAIIGFIITVFVPFAFLKIRNLFK